MATKVLEVLEGALTAIKGDDPTTKYRQLVMKVTEQEKTEKEKAGENVEALEKAEYDYYWRRLCNSRYFKQVRGLFTV